MPAVPQPDPIPAGPIPTRRSRPTPTRPIPAITPTITLTVTTPAPTSAWASGLGIAGAAGAERVYRGGIAGSAFPSCARNPPIAAGSVQQITATRSWTGSIQTRLPPEPLAPYPSAGALG